MVPPVYLDHNATTPVLPVVSAAMARAREHAWANPASVHAAGRAARAALEDARERIASALAVPARAVVFVSGGTEANNWALRARDTLVTSRLEHPSVTREAERREAAGLPVWWLGVTEGGTVSLDDLERTLCASGSGTQVALMAVNHETGVIQPVPEAAALVERHGGRLHVDAVQWFAKGPTEALAGADTLSVTAHKLGGPKGIGALVFRDRAPPPLLFGGSQERGLRPGTQDAVLATGFAVAVEQALAQRAARVRLAALRDRLERGLAAVAIRNGAEPRLGHVSNLSFPGRSGPELLAALDLLGVCAASGSACSAGTLEPSEVITAMLGLERARSAVRFSLGDTTSEADVDCAVAAVLRVLAVG